MNFELLIGLLLALPILSVATLIDEKGRVVRRRKIDWNAPVTEDAGPWTNWKDCVEACKAKGEGWTTYDTRIESFIRGNRKGVDECTCKIDRFQYNMQKIKQRDH